MFAILTVCMLAVVALAAFAVTVNYKSALGAVETLANNTTSAPEATRKITHTSFDATAAYAAASSPPVTTIAAGELTMTGGAGSLDLTALVGTNGKVVDGSGLRVQFLKLINKTGNANVITVTEGASNGYDGLGASFSITLAPGGEILLKAMDAGGDIAAGNKILDVTGTGSQVLQYAVVMG